MEKKTIRKIIFIVILLYLLLSFVRHITRDSLFSAAVNPENGTVTFLTTFDYELKTYDQSGNLIYETTLTENAGGYAYLDYQENKLLVYVLRTDELHCYDESGNMISRQTDIKSIGRAWNHWERDSKSYYYETDTHIYRYTYPRYWTFLFSGGKGEVTFLITEKDTNNDIVVWRENSPNT